MDGVPSSRGYTGGFGAALMRKDLGLAISAADAVGAPLPTGKTAFAAYDGVCEAGEGTRDFSFVYEILSKAAPAK